MRSQVLARLVHSANPNNKPKKSNPATAVTAATAATATAGRMRRARCVGGLAFSSPGATRGGPRAAGAVRRGLGGAGAGIAQVGSLSRIGLPFGLPTRAFRAFFATWHEILLAYERKRKRM